MHDCSGRLAAELDLYHSPHLASLPQRPVEAPRSRLRSRSPLGIAAPGGLRCSPPGLEPCGSAAHSAASVLHSITADGLPPSFGHRCQDARSMSVAAPFAQFMGLHSAGKPLARISGVALVPWLRAGPECRAARASSSLLGVSCGAFGSRILSRVGTGNITGHVRYPRPRRRPDAGRARDLS